MLRRFNLEKIGQRLARVDRHLFQTLASRIGAGSLSEAVAVCKRKQQGPMLELIRPDIENQRIAQAITWAERLGLDPNYAASVLYGIMSESCRTQINFLHQHFNDQESEEDNSDADWKFYREELLRLTKAVVSDYDEAYTRESFGTKIYLDFEKKQIDNLINNLDDYQLALDLGCATGAKSIMLANSFQRVVGYDISPQMIEQAKLKLREENDINKRISFELVDLEIGIPQEDNSVSLVLMNFGTGSDINNIDKLLEETHRVLRPGGKFLFSFYNANSLLLKLGFLPWPTSLAAMIDTDKQCLEVHFKKELFLIYAKPYTCEELEQLFSHNNLSINNLFTHPSFSAILPEDILTTETFKSYADLTEGQRYRQAIVSVDDNQAARDALDKVDRELAESTQYLGVYIIAAGMKKI